jgi:hypothetical protein
VAKAAQPDHQGNGACHGRLGGDLGVGANTPPAHLGVPTQRLSHSQSGLSEGGGA